jgi:uncharacterized membrane protein
MRVDRTTLLKLLWAIYGAMWVGGVMRLRDPGWASPAFLFAAGAIALLSAPAQWKELLGVAAVGFVAETIGVKTGFPFGRYLYTGTLAPSLFGVPLAIACAWMVLFAFVRQFTRNVWLAATLLTATDLLIDPLASGALGFWRWSVPGLYFGVPISNFAGWFLVSLLMFALNRQTVEKNVSQRVLGASVLLFFAARV